MSIEPDPIFKRLREERVPAALASICDDVLGDLELARTRRALRRGAMAACLAAALVGVWVGANEDIAPASEPAGLLAIPGSAPSQLLTA